MEKINKKELRKHLIFMWNYWEWGGAQIYFLAIIKEAKKNWDITVILPRGSKPEITKYIEEVGVKYEFIDTRIDFSSAATVTDKLARQWRRISSELKAFYYLLKWPANEYILHIETAPWQSWLFVTALAMRGGIFVTMHNALPPNSRWREFIWRKRLNFILGLKNFHLFVANQNAKDSLKHLLTADNWEKITLTRASINPSEIEKTLSLEIDLSELKSKHEIPADKFVVLCVGQFIDRKGRWVFLEAAQKILKKNPDEFFFVWLTPVWPTEEENRKIRELKIESGFKLILSEAVGKNRSDILSFFRIADVFALPSYFEGLPIAVLEAMALGIPTIASNITAIPEAVKNFETGLLIEPGDSDALIEAILKLNQDPDLMGKLAEAGQKFVLENFDERKAAKIAIEKYEEGFQRGK